jgi:WD40 repeat protein
MKWNRGEITSSGILQQMRTLETAQEDNPDYWRCLGWLHLEQGDIEAVEKIQQSNHRIKDKDFLRAYSDPNRPVGRQLRLCEGHTDRVNSVAISPNGRFVLSGSSDNTMRLWELASGRQLRVFEGHTDSVTSVAFSPDGRYALSGVGGTLCLWETGKVNSLALSPDGRFILSGSDDRTLRLWEAATGKVLHVFRGHADDVYSVAFSPDWRFVLAGSADETMRLWRLGWNWAF